MDGINESTSDKPIGLQVAVPLCAPAAAAHRRLPNVWLLTSNNHSLNNENAGRMQLMMPAGTEMLLVVRCKPAYACTNVDPRHDLYFS